MVCLRGHKGELLLLKRHLQPLGALAILIFLYVTLYLLRRDQPMYEQQVAQ